MDKKTEELGNSLLRELHQTNHLLRMGTKPGEQDEDAIGDQNKSADQGEAAGPSTVVDSDLRPRPKKRDHPHRKWYASFEWWKTRLEAAGIIAAIIYAGITYRQWRDAKIGMHMAEQAYLSVGLPSIDAPHKSLLFSLVNTGHIPARDIDLIVYRVLINSNDPSSTFLPFSAFSEYGRVDVHIASLSNMQAGLPHIIGTSFDGFDEAKIQSANQQLVVVALTTYNSGFDDEARKNFSFCLKTEREKTAQIAAAVECDPATYLPPIKNFLHEK